jgi:hypothetical protein
MPYLLRFVQTFQPSAAQAFFELEAQFEALGAARQSFRKAGGLSCCRKENQPTFSSGKVHFLHLRIWRLR